MQLVDVDDLSLDSVTALDADNSAECGILVKEQETLLQALTRLLGSGNAFILPDEDGVFQLGRLALPSGIPLDTFSDFQILGDKVQRISVDDGEQPAKTVTIQYGQLGVVLGDSDVGQDVNADQRVYLTTEWRAASVTNSAILTKYPNAPIISIDSCFRYQADALAEAQRQLDMHGTERAGYTIELPLPDGEIAQPSEEIGISIDRFGLDSGASFIVLGRVDDRAGYSVEVDLWGGVPLIVNVIAVNFRIAASDSSYELTGSAASIRHSSLAADVGAYALTGTDVTLSRIRSLVAGAGSYALTGTTASVLHSPILGALSGSYALTGADVTLTISTNKVLIAGAGSYTLSGTNASVLHTWNLAATAGSYSLTGTNAAVTPSSASVGQWDFSSANQSSEILTAGF